MVQDELPDARRPRGRYPAYTRGRLAQFARRLRQAIYPHAATVDRMAIAGPTDRIARDDAMRLPFRDCGIGEQLGPRWATYWVRVNATVPEAWRGARVDLYWDSRSEALLRLNGHSKQGLNPDRHTAVLIDRARGGETIEFTLEVACNGMFGAGDEIVHTGREDYRIHACELRRFDPKAWRLYYDFEALRQLEADREPPQSPRSHGGVPRKIVRPALDTTWAGRLLHELNRVCNAADPRDPGTWKAAHAILAPLLAAKNGSVSHELSAIGHAHLDTAWLWPIDETRRKAQRTFATAIDLMERYPEFKFACSQAYQYAVIEETDPELFARIRAKIASGQWIPTGGSWVEPDCNLPWGESLCRQFLYGQRYFESHFGARSTVFWNPDVFGYDGQLPQLMREAGMTRFLTQKLSWNRFTQPPHHSFRWRGIDGSEVLTHFPPVDTYNANGAMEELRYHAANYKDADRSADAFYLFGYGDGGGGANAEMIELLARAKDLQGVPRSSIRTPDEFFDRLARDTDSLGAVDGELYFEYHRGVYTSQAETKRLNRLCETRLQALEFLAVASALSGRAAPAPAEIEKLWRTVLTNQFHDILPGSSIGEVYARTRAELSDTAEEARHAARRMLDALCEGEGALPINTLGFARAEVTKTPDDALAYVSAAPFSAGAIGACRDEAMGSESADVFVLENDQMSARLSRDGLLQSLVHNASGREALSGPANRMLLHEDRPLDYDAWDIDPSALETARDAAPALEAKLVLRGGLRAEVRFERKLGACSRMVQTVRLDAGSDHLEFDTTIDWGERKTLLRAMFPLAAHAPTAAYETMFGAAARPTHANTDADLAMYEVPGQRWADLSEHGFGVSLLSDVRHGYSCFGNKLALSLLRGPVSPDANADIGKHHLRYALYPHEGDWRAANTVAHAACFARPLLWATGKPAAILERPLVQASPSNVVIDTIKQAEDGEGWVIRLYESHGGSTVAHLDFGVPVRAAWLSNTLEDKIAPLTLAANRSTLALRPFHIATIRLR